MLVEDVDAQHWSRQDDDTTTDDEAHYEAVARPMTASCVDAIIRRATDHLEVAAPPSPGRLSLEEAVSHAGAAIVTPMAHSAVAASPAKRARCRRSGSGGGGCFRAAGAQGTRGADIARVLDAPRCPAEVREYAASVGGGFGRVPAFLRPVVAHLDSEQRYIISLIEQREAPQRRVRLLAEGEKERRLGGLRQQLQKASALASQARPRGQAAAGAQADVARLAEEVAFFDRPYVFVEAPG